MPRRTATVITTNHEGSWLSLPANCATCNGCKSANPKQLFVSHKVEGEVSLTLGQRALYFALFHSLILPLLLFVFMTLVAESLHLNEVVGIILASSCFILGMFMCRALPAGKLRIEEVNHVKN